MLVNKKYIKIGKGCRIDKKAIVGEAPLRKIKTLELKIGRGSAIFSGAVIYAGSNIAKNTVIAHNSIVREENIIGNNFSLWNNSVVDYGCKIGKNAKIHCNVYIAQFTEIEDDVFIGPGAIFTNDLHPRCMFSKKCLRGPYIKKGAIIGANATINPYIVIGKSSLVGSGSVVTKDVPNRKVVAGNPARVVCDIKDIRCSKGFTDFPYRTK